MADTYGFFHKIARNQFKCLGTTTDFSTALAMSKKFPNVDLVANMMQMIKCKDGTYLYLPNPESAEWVPW